jgi:hypothetical protein
LREGCGSVSKELARERQKRAPEVHFLGYDSLRGWGKTNCWRRAHVCLDLGRGVARFDGG